MDDEKPLRKLRECGGTAPTPQVGAAAALGVGDAPSKIGGKF